MVGNFYTFSKRHNSTLTPTGSGESVSFTLKDATSVLSPVLEINSLSQPPAWNYVYITAFHRYYFVDNWSYYRGIWSAELSVDLLASWKSAILSTSALVIFSSTAYHTYAIDNRIAAQAIYTRTETWEDMSGIAAGNPNIGPTGVFIIDVLNNNSVWATGCSTKYILTYQQMQLFAKAMLEPGLWEQLKQYFTNPLDGLLDCYYLPISITQFLDLTTDVPIYIGEYQVPGVQAKTTLATSLAVKTKTVSVSIPWGYNDFRRCSKFTTLDFFVPFCGESSLPVDEMVNCDSFSVDYTIDPNSGNIQAICYVNNSDTDHFKVLQEYSGNIKVQLPVGQVQSRVGDMLGATPAVMTSVAGFATGNVALGAQGLLSAVSSMAVPATIRKMGGFNGSVSGAVIGGPGTRWRVFRLTTTSLASTADPVNLRPVCGNVYNAVRSLSGLSGYCQTAGASVSINGSDTERNQINTLLDAGIYIE